MEGSVISFSKRCQFSSKPGQASRSSEKNQTSHQEVADLSLFISFVVNTRSE